MSLVYTKQAVKDLKHLGPVIKPRVLAALKDISSNPGAGKRLKGPLEHLRSFRVGEYRILYAVQAHRQVTIMTIVPRGSAYK